MQEISCTGGHVIQGLLDGRHQIKTMGKRQRFERLVQSYSTDMFRYALWLSGNKEVAEDLVQEAFTRAWKNLHQLRQAGKEKAWLMTIVRNENARRFQRVQPDFVDIITPPETHLPLVELCAARGVAAICQKPLEVIDVLVSRLPGVEGAGGHRAGFSV